MNLADNLVALQEELKTSVYMPTTYRVFEVFEPKRRLISAPAYRDRVVQHSLCDNLLGPVVDRHLVYDNAACRLGKGTHFAMGRLTRFMAETYRATGSVGYALKVDVRHYFDNVRHDVLLKQVERIFPEVEVVDLLRVIMESYHSQPGMGLPLGNQTSQWLALLYLDPIDRLVKEGLRLRGYTRYMDDMVVVHESRDMLRDCLRQMRAVAKCLGLDFNSKTQITSLSQGVTYLGFHFHQTPQGKVVRRLASGKKPGLKRGMAGMVRRHNRGELTASDVGQRVSAHFAHLKHGHTYGLRSQLCDSLRCERASAGDDAQ
ncbi:MAG: reverse transcriptase/maturase family protein [Propionibacteriaceae bacterium]|nr:reverse transcriptase/maturase family protein [Propionibacteriaceae bacterium]